MRVSGVPRNEGEYAQVWLGYPLQVVQYDGEGSHGGDRSHQQGHVLEDTEPQALLPEVHGIVHHRCLHLGEELQCRRVDRFDPSPDGLHLPVRELDKSLPDRFDEQVVWLMLDMLGGGVPYDKDLHEIAVVEDLVHEPALADSRLAGQEGEPRGVGNGFLEELSELLEFPSPADHVTEVDIQRLCFHDVFGEEVETAPPCLLRPVEGLVGPGDKVEYRRVRVLALADPHGERYAHT